jgi:hypothetical protein
MDENFLYASSEFSKEDWQIVVESDDLKIKYANTDVSTFSSNNTFISNNAEINNIEVNNLIANDAEIDNLISNNAIFNVILGPGGANTASINGIIPVLADQIDAEVGSDNLKIMTPLRVSESIIYRPKRVLLVDDNSFIGQSLNIISYENLPSYPRYECEFVFGNTNTNSRTLIMSIRVNGNYISVGAISANVSWAGTSLGGLQGIATLYNVNADNRGGGILKTITARPDGTNSSYTFSSVDRNISRTLDVLVDAISFSWSSDSYSVANGQYLRIYGVNP